MVVVLGERDDEALAGDLEAAAARHLHIGTLELAEHGAVAREHGHVEAIAVAVADEHVAVVAHVDAVGEVGDVLAANAAQEVAVLVEDDHTVALEVAHKVLVAVDGDVRGLAHVVGAVEPLDEVAVLLDAEDGGRDAVDGDDLVVLIDGEAGHDVDVLDGDLAEEVAALVEYLHARALGAAVAHHVLARVAHHDHLARKPELALVATRRAEVVLELAALGEHLDAVVVRVGHDDLLVRAEAEAVRRVELRARRAERAELVLDLHVAHLAVLAHGRVEVAVAGELVVALLAVVR